MGKSEPLDSRVPLKVALTDDPALQGSSHTANDMFANDLSPFGRQAAKCVPYRQVLEVGMGSRGVPELPRTRRLRLHRVQPWAEQFPL